MQKVRKKMDDYKKFCMKCSWNDLDYGCSCPAYEEIYQCPMYMYYHPEEVKKFEEAMEKWIKQKAESEE